MGVSFNCEGNQEYCEKNIDLPQVIDKLRIILVVIDTDYIGRCKSNYHTIAAMKVQIKKNGTILITNVWKNLHYCFFLFSFFF